MKSSSVVIVLEEGYLSMGECSTRQYGWNPRMPTSPSTAGEPQPGRQAAACDRVAAPPPAPPPQPRRQTRHGAVLIEGDAGHAAGDGGIGPHVTHRGELGGATLSDCELDLSALPSVQTRGASTASCSVMP